MTEVVTAPAPAAPAPESPAAPDTSISAASGTTAQNPADSAPATPPGSDKPATPDPAEKRQQSRFERRIDKLHRRAAEAEARAGIYEKQLQEARSQQPPKGDPQAPTLAQFDYDPEKYARATADYEKTKAFKEHDEKIGAHAAKQEYERLQATWEEKAAKAEAKYEDFDEVVGDLQPTNPIIAAIIEADNAEDLAYFLGKNPSEAKRIASLPVRAALREIGKLEAKLLAQPVKPKQPSQAPAPITPVSGAVPANAAPNPNKDFGAWMKSRQKQEGKVA